MNEFTRYELMELILSVWSCLTEQGEKSTKFDKEVDEIYEIFIQRYDVGEYGRSQQKQDSENLLAKLLKMYEEMMNEKIILTETGYKAK